MSLIAWFPFTGNLKNQGIDGTITATATGATVANAGKIGRCYHLTTAQRLTINNVPYSSLTHASISVWLKVVSNENSFLIVSGPGSGRYVLASDNGTGNLRNSILGGTANIYVDGVKQLAPGTRGQWHHYCITDVDISDWTNMFINYYNGSTTAGWNFTGDVNDFRIYDHILSAREVHEISKGLFVHYKLDNNVETYTNIATIMSDYYGLSTSCYNGATNTYNYGSNNVYREYYFEQRTQVIKVYCPDVDSSIYPYVYFGDGTEAHGLSPGLAKSKTKTLSFDFYPHFINGAKSVIFYTYRSDKCNTTLRNVTTGTTVTNSNVTTTSALSVAQDTWNHITLTLTTTAASTQLGWGYMRIGTGTRVATGEDYWLIKNIQITTTDHEVPYVFPGQTAGDSEIDDGSGYMHVASINGKIYNEAESPRYSHAIRISDGRTNYLTSAPIYFPTDRITLSCWIKGPQTAGYESYDIILGIGGSTRAFEISLYDTTGIFRQGFVVGGTRSVLNTNPVLDNTWHMLTATYNGSAIKRYIDGVEVNSTSVSGALNNGPYAIYIGRFDGDDGYAINNVRISDVRIYSTALSATDVFELYHTSAWIDDLADQFSYELIETSENIFTSENLMKYRHNTSAGGYGEWVERNGENAIAVSPARFYTSSTKVYANILADEFRENTQYIFDMYIDMDGVVSSGVNREGGFTIYYTDGTSNVTALRFTSNGSMGFVHKRYITPANKSVSYLRTYYYAGASVFYKFGSTITEYKSPAVSIKKTGFLETGETKEDYERVNASYVNGGLLETREKYEF